MSESEREGEMRVSERVCVRERRATKSVARVYRGTSLIRMLEPPQVQDRCHVVRVRLPVRNLTMEFNFMTMEIDYVWNLISEPDRTCPAVLSLHSLRYE